MGFRFRRRIKILPGITINLSKKGLSSLSLARRSRRDDEHFKEGHQEYVWHTRHRLFVPDQDRTVDKPAQERAQCAAKSSGDVEFNTATRAARRPEGIGMEGGIRVGMPHASSDCCGRDLFAHPATRETDHLRAYERDTKRASSRGDTHATAGRYTGRADCGVASGAGETASADCSATSGAGETASA